MCVNCGVSSCSSCNSNPYIPSNTSALKYDGAKFVCPTYFTILPGSNLNDVINTIMNKVCANTSAAVGGGLLKEARVIISKSDILAMHNTDKELLPASALFGYDVHSIILKLVQVTTDYIYTNPGDDFQLKAKMVGPTAPAPAGETTHTFGGFLEVVNDIVTAGVVVPSSKMVEFHQNPLWTTHSNTGLFLSTTIPGEVYTTGDHTMVAIITYREIPA